MRTDYVYIFVRHFEALMGVEKLLNDYRELREVIWSVPWCAFVRTERASLLKRGRFLTSMWPPPTISGILVVRERDVECD